MANSTETKIKSIKWMLNEVWDEQEPIVIMQVALHKDREVRMDSVNKSLNVYN